MEVLGIGVIVLVFYVCLIGLVETHKPNGYNKSIG